MSGLYVYALDADGHLAANGVRSGTTTAMGLAVVLFYVLLTPIWLGIRAAGWLASKRS